MEIWKPVVGYEGVYEVSDLGRIKSLPRNTAHLRIMSPSPDKYGYWHLGLTMNGKRDNFYVHVLVAIAFIGPIPEGKEVNHIDGDRSNNKLTNLEYLTPLQNTRHAIDVLGKWGALSWRRFTDDEVREIRSLRSQGVILRLLADKFGLTIPGINDVIKRRTYKDVK